MHDCEAKWLKLNAGQFRANPSSTDAQGPTGGLLTADEPCAFAADACVDAATRWPREAPGFHEQEKSDFFPVC
jgi:hypothetical protein